MKIFILLSGLLFTSCSQPAAGDLQSQTEHDMNASISKSIAWATFGSGCFWCSEAIFSRLNGVSEVSPGYSGGSTENPTYTEVKTGSTGHAEVIQVAFDPTVISYLQLLEVFFKTHDPTTLNRQGADVGTQYRSVIFYHDEGQKAVAQKVKERLNGAGIWDDPIVTEISPLKTFYVAEDYHHNYFEKNPNQGYCQFVVLPKVKKFEKQFEDLLKE
jgi:peptide-methionine (S)-S-oxide reductase